MLGLGQSIGTVAAGITAELVVVADETELNGTDATGKIVLFNNEFTSYGASGLYRRSGAAIAAAAGAVAALVRSVTPFSLRTPHTGSSTTASIPAAAITLEDANMFKRMQDRGENISLTLTMGATGCQVDTRLYEPHLRIALRMLFGRHGRATSRATSPFRSAVLTWRLRVFCSRSVGRARKPRVQSSELHQYLRRNCWVGDTRGDCCHRWPH